MQRTRRAPDWGRLPPEPGIAEAQFRVQAEAHIHRSKGEPMSDQPESVETRGDERVELLAADTNDDGRPDVWIVDTDGDGTPDMFQFDTDFDGKVDITMVDLDEDGKPDEVVDGDGGHPPAP
jgi:hypothetical protein